MRVRRILSAFILLIFLAVAAPEAAAGGGSWMKSPDDWVEPGEEVEMVAYVGASNIDFGPWEAYLNLKPIDARGNVGNDRIALGPVVIEVSGLTGYLSHRVYLSFTLPDDLVPGIYQISVTNPEGDFLGDLIGGHLPVYTQNLDVWYEWPVNEPLVAMLPDHAMLAGSGGPVSVGEIRRGVTPTSTTVSPEVTTTAVTPAAVTTAVTTNAVLVQVPTTVIPIQVPDDVEEPESPWLLIAGVAITVGCLVIGSRVVDDAGGSYHTTETDPVVDHESVGAVPATSSTTGRN